MDSYLALFAFTSLLLFFGFWFGGNVQPPAVTIASDFIRHSTGNNNNAPTLLSTLVIPPNTVTGLQLLRYDLMGEIANSSGVNQNTPTIAITLAGITIFQGPLVTALPTSANPYFYRLSMLIAPVNGTVTALWCQSQFAITPVVAGAEILRFTQYAGPAFDPTVGQSLQVTITNSVSNAGVFSTVETAQLQAT